nr:hypothetical protein [Tanacetum cinerariifolium]
METQKPMLKDEDGDVHMYRLIIGSLMYLTSSRPDIMFAMCVCTRYQVNLKVLHLHAVKRIFRCRLISWQCKKQTVVANSTTEAEYVAASSCYGQVLWIQNQLLDYGDCNEKKLIQMVKILADKNVADLLTKAFDSWSTAMAKTINGEVQLHAQVYGKEIVITESSVRRDLQLAYEEGIDCLPNSIIFEQLALMGKPTRKDTQATPNEPSSQGTDSGGGPRCQETIGDTIAQTRFERVSKHSNDSLLVRGNTLQSDEDRLKLDEIMTLCTNLQNRVHDLEKTKTTQQQEIASLKRRVKKLEKRNRSRTHKLKKLYKVGLSSRVESSGDEESLGEDASKQGRRIDAIDADEDITLVSVQDDAEKEMFDVDVLGGEEMFVVGQNENVVEEVVDAAQVSTAATAVTISTKEITLAQALKALKTSKPKVKRIVFQEPDKSLTTTIISSQQSHDKELRLAREKYKKEERANIALIETWDDIQAKINADHQLAERLQAQEQEELSDAEKATLFQQLLKKRRKHFAAKREEEKRNKPPTKSQQRKIMCTYLKNIEGYKLKDLKLKDFDSIQELFDKAFKRVNTFEDFRTELVEGKEKRVGTELEQEITKKQKMKDDKEKSELKQLMKTIPYEEEVAIDAIPLPVKSPRIVDWNIHKEGKKSYYQIVRADGKSQMYMIFSQMLKIFDMEDLED